MEELKKAADQADDSAKPEEQQATGEVQQVSDGREGAEKMFASYLQMFRNKEAEEVARDERYVKMAGQHKFWDQMPMPKPQTLPTQPAGPMLRQRREEVLQEPVRLPDGFGWCAFSMQTEKDVEEIYTMLTNNYVEDDEGYFRFDYSADFLKWALTPPGYHADLIFGIRELRTGRLVGFITALIVRLGIEGKEVQVSEVNFLCVVKAFRKYSIASVLIREVTRRSNLKAVWQGFYTSGTLLPTPFAEARYYHRSLNPRKLIAARFSYLPPSQTIGIYQKLHAVPETLTFELRGQCRRAEPQDLKQMKKLLDDFLRPFAIHVCLSVDEFKHFFMPRSGVIESYVVEFEGRITDFFSFYSLPSTVLDPKCPHKKINAAYAYYFVHSKHTVEEIFEVAILQAKHLGYDVFNALDIMDYGEVFSKLNFHPGDGFLKYYLFNWVLENKLLPPSQLGAVLL